MRTEKREPKRKFGEMPDWAKYLFGMIVGAYFYRIISRIIELYF